MTRSDQNYRKIFGNQASALFIVGLAASIEYKRKSYDPIVAPNGNLFNPDEIKLIGQGEMTPSVNAKAGIVLNAGLRSAEHVCFKRGWNPNEMIGDQLAVMSVLGQIADGKKNTLSFSEHAIATAKYANKVQPIAILNGVQKMGSFIERRNADTIENVVERLRSEGEITEAKVFDAVNKKEFDAAAESLRTTAMILRAGYQKYPEYMKA